MKKLIFLVFFVGCINADLFGLGSRDPNIFFLQGKEVRIEDTLLEKFRMKWSGHQSINLSVSDSIVSSDIQWILDFIALSEVINSQGCNDLKFIKSRDFDESLDAHEEPSRITPILFDYVWEIKVCGKDHKYRVVNSKETDDILVYPIQL